MSMVAPLQTRMSRGATGKISRGDTGRKQDSQSSSVAGYVVAEDDAAHARLSGPGLAHEKNFLFLGLLDLVPDIRAGVWWRGFAK